MSFQNGPFLGDMLSFEVPFLLQNFMVPKDRHPHFGRVPALHSKVEHFSCSRAENFREPSLLFTRASVDTTTKEKEHLIQASI